jgi:hypothetical protein
MYKTLRRIVGAVTFLSVSALVPPAFACDCAGGGCGCVTIAIQPNASDLASKIEAILAAKGITDKVDGFTIVLVPKPAITTPLKPLSCTPTATGTVCSRH